jgi:hypothetical protein
LTDPTFSEAKATGVSVTPFNSTAVPITVTLDISAIPVNTTADLVFSVGPVMSLGSDPVISTPASIEISDVTINGIVATIPEPRSIVLLGMGFAAIAGRVWRKRAK